ncbi:PREDICTED: B-box domain protein 31-like [Camelina sativa]|uniref:B-box domain protein 31-like n=1 Tax=Camelina sativa TaxID=90675 RepID=A0ABM0Z5P0_CAMSA|nr:PREDICTED: B-box domain protein 31-like [Camelina sativa]
MCRGLNEEESRRRSDGGGGGCRNLCTTPSVPVRCELCSGDAYVFCEADSAFLCRKCDRWVHGANFLAWRHVRRVLCTSCQKLTRRCLVGDHDIHVVLTSATTTLEDNRSEQVSSNHDEVPFVFL